MNEENLEHHFPVIPVSVTALFAVISGVLIALEMPTYSVLSGLLGLGATVAFWLRELAVREQAWQLRLNSPATRKAATDSLAAQEKWRKELSMLQSQWVPTLENQLTTARTQMESAICEITESFSTIHERLGETSRLAGDAAGTLGGSGAGLAEKVQGTLSDMLSSINKSLEEKATMFEEVKSFINSTDELARMASSVEELAAKTNLLALNAAIEAARAGEEGRGFSIVADEVRKLSMLSAETGQQIRRRVEEISAAARRAGDGANRMQVSDGKLLSYAQDTVNDVVGSFHSVTEPLKNTSEKIVDNTSRISDGLNNAVVNFQFQDRVSQILCHVDESLKSLQSQIVSQRDLNVQELMGGLSKRYTMAEERINHSPARTGTSHRSASPSVSSAPAAAPKSGDLDITFF